MHKPFAYLWLDGKYARIQGATKRPYAVHLERNMGKLAGRRSSRRHV